MGRAVLMVAGFLALTALSLLFFRGEGTVPPPAPAPPPVAKPEGMPAPVPADPAPSTPLPPLSIEEVDRLLQRAQPNLYLHGLSLHEVHLRRALEDYRSAARRMPADGGNLRIFDANFSLAFCIARMDPFPSEEPARAALLDEAVRGLGEAARIEGSFPGLWIVGGILQEQRGDPKQAVEDITQGLATLEKAADLKEWQRYQLRLFGLLARTRALIHPSVNREDLAVKDAGEADTLAGEALRNPDAPRATRLRSVVRTHLAAALERMGDFPAAEKVLAGLIQEDPDNFDHRFNLAIVLAGQQKFDGSLLNYRAAAGLAPRDPRPHLKIGYILLTYPPAGGEPDAAAAEREAEIFLSLTGAKSAEYCALRGESAFVRRNLKEAEAWFRESLRLDPECIHSLDRLVRILGETENPSAERRAEMEEFRRRLTEGTQRRSPGGKDGDEGRGDKTFC